MHQQPTSPLPVDPPAAAPPPGPPGPPAMAPAPVGTGGGGQAGRALDRWLDLLWVRVLYALLALLLVVFPLTASALRRVTPLPGQALRRPGLAATLAEGGIYAAAGALLVYSWIQAVPILQRPIFTWPGGTPTVEAMAQLQQRGGWVLLAALLGAVVRVALEALSWADAGARERQARFGAMLARA